MKKVIVFVLAILICFGLVACGFGKSQEATLDYADQDFIKDLGKALEKRFDAVEKADSASKGDALSDLEEAERTKKVVDIELDALMDYRNKQFEDAKLQESVLSYLNSLQDSKDAFADISTDYYGALEKYDAAYSARLKLLSIFSSEYSLAVDDSHSDILNDLLTRAKSIERQDAVIEAVENVISTVVFEEVENSYGWKKYRGVLDNTSGYDIDYVSYTIDLMDGEGTVIEQNYASANNIVNGKKYNIEFSTDIDFTSYEYIVDYTIAK